MRDMFIIGIDNAVKDGDLEGLLEQAEYFSEEDYPEHIGFHHYMYLWDAIELLKENIGE